MSPGTGTANAAASSADAHALRQAVIDTARAMSAAGLNHGTSGNVSVRHGDGFLITPSGVPDGALTPDAIVALNMAGEVAGGEPAGARPSSEWRFHRDIYASRPDAGAIVHAHPIHATAFAMCREALPAAHYMIAAAGGPTIRCADYATFGTQALSDAAIVALRGRLACLLANHGLIALGPTLERALWLAVEVEVLAHQYAVARMIGRPVILDDAEIARNVEKFRAYGPRPADEGGAADG